MRARERLDRVSFIAGLAMIAMGGLLLADQGEAVDLSLGLFAAIVAAVLGAILLISGFDDGGRDP